MRRTLRRLDQPDPVINSKKYASKNKQMKIFSLIMFMAGIFFLWLAIRAYYLKRVPFSSDMIASSNPQRSRPGAYATYFLGYAAATFYLSSLFDREGEGQFIAVPVICALLALWRQILVRRP